MDSKPGSIKTFWIGSNSLNEIRKKIAARNQLQKKIKLANSQTFIKLRHTLLNNNPWVKVEIRMEI